MRPTWLLALGALALCACSSAESSTNSLEAVASTSQPLIRPGWYSLASASHSSFDVSMHLICAADANGTGDTVRCYRATQYGFESYETLVTNWGTGTGATHPIPGGYVKSVAILRRPDIALQPKRPNAAAYEIYALGSDNTVRYTSGISDRWYEGDNFKSYTTFMWPVSADGLPLQFKKIMWMNEDGLDNSYAGKRMLFAITYDNKLYRTDRSQSAWQLHTTGIKDMGHASGMGATFLTTSGWVWYDRFSDDPKDFSGYLPKYSAANITAVGGLWALTDAGAGGGCNETFCAQDDKRVIRFSWRTWSWETWLAQLQASGFNVQSGPESYMGNYFPLAQPQSCLENECIDPPACNQLRCIEPAVSPLVKGAIVDPNRFGSDYYPCAVFGTQSICFDHSFDLGPFVARYGQRAYFYNPDANQLPVPFHTCMPKWDDSTQDYDPSSCGDVCATEEDGTYCGFGTDRACRSGVCQACGGSGQPCCVGKLCPNGTNLSCGSDNRCYTP